MRADRTRARPLPAAAMLLAALLPGCAGDSDLALVNPSKYDFYSCTQLERAMKSDRDQALEFRALAQKAAREPVGVVIGKITYGPEISSVDGDMKVIEQAAREKQCDPPILAGPDLATP